jgi:hypothetical protein
MLDFVGVSFVCLRGSAHLFRFGFRTEWDDGMSFMRFTNLLASHLSLRVRIRNFMTFHDVLLEKYEDRRGSRSAQVQRSACR